MSPNIPLSGGPVTVSNSLTKARFVRLRRHPLRSPRPHQRRPCTIHPPLFPAANRLPTCDRTASSAASLRRHPDVPMKIRKAVFPVAGLGTRVLPATKAMPKEMLTIVDKPLIQYVVDEAREAGIEHFIFVTGRNKGVIEDHFDRMFELDATLAGARQEGRDGDSGARPARSRRHELHPPAGAARPRPRGVVRARHRRRRAVRGGAAGRTGAEHAGLPRADDRGRQASSATNPT